MSEVEYFYKKDEQIIGPMSHAEILSLVKNGTLGREAQVMRADVKIWISAHDIPDLPKNPKDYYMLPDNETDEYTPVNKNPKDYYMLPDHETEDNVREKKIERPEEALAKARRYIWFIVPTWILIFFTTCTTGYIYMRGGLRIHAGFNYSEFFQFLVVPAVPLVILLIICRPSLSVLYFTLIPPAALLTLLSWPVKFASATKTNQEFFLFFFFTLATLIISCLVYYKTKKWLVFLTLFLLLGLLLSVFI